MGSSFSVFLFVSLSTILSSQARSEMQSFDIRRSSLSTLMPVYGIDQSKCDIDQLNAAYVGDLSKKGFLGRAVSLASNLRGNEVAAGKACSGPEGYASSECIASLDAEMGKKLRAAAYTVPGCSPSFAWAHSLALAVCKDSSKVKEEGEDKSLKTCVFKVSKCPETSVDLESLNFKCEKIESTSVTHQDRSPYYVCEDEQRKGLAGCTPANPNSITRTGGLINKSESVFNDGAQ